MIIGTVDTGEVRIGEEELDVTKSQQYHDYSEWFGWGINNDDTKQLALAILLSFTDGKFAKANCEEFARDVLAKKDKDHTLTMQEMAVVDWASKRGYRW